MATLSRRAFPTHSARVACRFRLAITGVIVSLNRSLNPLKTPGWTALQARGGLKKKCRSRAGPG